MSSKRGRKRNDNLPPNRARDVQRAFRARRAAHLQALEERVAELEDENDGLRAALNLPPAHRPPLGHGPTGKDKVKPFDRGSTAQTESVADEGSASPRTNTSSPHSINQQIPSVSHSGDGGETPGGIWDQALSMAQHDEYASDRDLHPAASANVSSATASYTPEPHYRFDTAPPSRSRSSLSGALFASPGASAYHNSIDRPSTSSSQFSRDEQFYNSVTSGLPAGHSASSSLRGLSQASPPMHPHSHQMESSLSGGTTHSSLAPHGSYTSSPSPASMSLGTTLGLRRSIPDLPQHFPSSYVDTFPSASYSQRAHPILLHQPPAHAPLSPIRLSPSRPAAPHLEYGGPEPPSDPSVRRTT
ncbi:hypothetical protein DFH11DRAFT_1572573 [Phellopilus nigrolimitatus]|nr:hypothetical protein DFH11DRAFT_1572573 [Phellopilus nigrolimitatus]